MLSLYTIRVIMRLVSILLDWVWNTYILRNNHFWSWSLSCYHAFFLNIVHVHLIINLCTILIFANQLNKVGLSNLLNGKKLGCYSNDHLINNAQSYIILNSFTINFPMKWRTFKIHKPTNFYMYICDIQMLFITHCCIIVYSYYFKTFVNTGVNSD